MKRMIGMVSVALALCALGFAASGCAHEQIIHDQTHPELVFRDGNRLLYRGKQVSIRDAIKCIEKDGFTNKDTVAIRCEGDLSDIKAGHFILYQFRKAGYTRAILTTQRQGYSDSKYQSSLVK